MPTAMSVEKLSKAYQLGQIGTGTLTNDLKVWWAKKRRMPNPLLRIGETDHRNRDGETIWALNDVSFAVEQGEVLGIIGRNGAGKSTLLKVLSRITAPTQGKVRVKGRVASLLEVGTGFHPELTGRENIYLNGAILGMSRLEIDRKFDEIVGFSGIEKFIDTPAKRYSSGMYVRLAFAVAAHLEPEILLIDEVLAVGDAEFQKKCLGKMGDVAHEGRTVLFVSHNLNAVSTLCHRSIHLDGGRLDGDGDTENIIARYLSSLDENLIPTAPDIGAVQRSGTGQIRFSEFHMEDAHGHKLAAAQSGKDVCLVFGFRATETKMKHVDIGFSIHSVKTNQTLAVLYCSYQGLTFDIDSKEGSIRCKIAQLPLTAGRYRLGGRITVNHIEADWPRDGIGFFDVLPGDFYGTGHLGFGESAPLLVSGEWSVA